MPPPPPELFPVFDEVWRLDGWLGCRERSWTFLCLTRVVLRVFWWLGTCEKPLTSCTSSPPPIALTSWLCCRVDSRFLCPTASSLGLVLDKLAFRQAPTTPSGKEIKRTAGNIFQFTLSGRLNRELSERFFFCSCHFYWQDETSRVLFRGGQNNLCHGNQKP